MKTNLTAAERKAIEKWVKPLLGLLNDPALWAIRADLEESTSVIKLLYTNTVNEEIDARLDSPAKTSRRSYEEITK